MSSSPSCSMDQNSNCKIRLLNSRLQRRGCRISNIRIWRCRAMRERDAVSCLPSGCTHIEFEKALGLPGSLKTPEDLLLAGPVGKCILLGCMHPSQQAAVFEYLDLQTWSPVFLSSLRSLSFCCRAGSWTSTAI